MLIVNSEHQNLIQRIESLEKNKIQRKYVKKMLNNAKWYRIATLNSTGVGTTFLLSLSTTYNNKDNCSHLFSISITHNKAKITRLSSLINEKVILNLRIVKDALDNMLYIEIFYNMNAGNSVSAEIINDFNLVKMLDFADTTETSATLDEVVLNNLEITTGTEYETGRIIDNKKEYAKRISFGNLPNATVKSVSTGLSSSQINLIKVEGITSSGYPLPFVSTSSAYSIQMYCHGSGVEIKTSTDLSNQTAIVTIYYIKNNE